jgi:molecular chaperone DnaJ
MAARLPDLYGVLGVPRGASTEDIRRAYRRLARELHPDVNGDPQAEQRFKQAVAAYETLSDPVKRRQYDLFGQTGGGADVFGFADFGDIFEAFFGGGVGRRQRGGRRPSRTQAGEDLFVRVSLSFEEAAFGTTREVALDALGECDRCAGTGCEPGTSVTRCSRCGGAGEIQDVTRSLFGTVMTARTCGTCMGTGEQVVSPCTRCGGDGRVRNERTVSVDVPAGVADGMELRVTSSGNAGRAGGPIGDLYVSLHVEPHAIFERRGQDLVCALSVPMTMAALGSEVEIPMLDGEPTRVRLEAGTESGSVLRLRGQGIPNLGRRGRGDLYVTVVVETPKDLSKEERSLLEALAMLRGEMPTDRPAKRSGRLRKLLEK